MAELKTLFATHVYEESLAADRGFAALNADLADACHMLAVEDGAGRAGRREGGAAPAFVPPPVSLLASALFISVRALGVCPFLTDENAGRDASRSPDARDSAHRASKLTGAIR